MPRNPHRPHRRGFTLIEALVSITVAAMAASVLFSGIYANLQQSQSALEQITAQGIAEQTIDEVLGTMYVGAASLADLDPLQAFLGPNATEAAGAGRTRFNDTDDYNGFSSTPPQDPFGIDLGKDDGVGGTRHTSVQASSEFLKNWRQQISVYYVNASNPMLKVTTSPYSYQRAVEVVISKNEGSGRYRELARIRRVFGYVPPPE